MDSREPSILSVAYYEHEGKYDNELCGSMSRRDHLLGGENSKIGSANLPFPSAKVLKIEERMDEPSWSAPKGIFKQKIRLSSFIRFSKEWINDPLNVALLLWMICVTVSGAVLFLVMTGMLNNVLPSKSQREIWWKPNDIVILQKTYCKNGTNKPHEWKHIMVLLVLLHINCFAQYALTGLNLGYRKPKRSVFGVSVCLAVAILAAAGAGSYSIFSPLGKEYNCNDGNEENPNRIEENISYASRIVDKPQWRGGLFHVLDDIKTACLSLFCSFCLFGWNMERLGFGNVYVHIATFVIFCTAPLCLFGLAANIVDPLPVKVALSLIGVLLSVFGLLYGGYWRIQMRKRFDLPKNNSCWGQPNIADFVQWFFCCCCSLAQEVRTADYYCETLEDNLRKNRKNINGDNKFLSPLPREGGTVHEFWNSANLTEMMATKDVNSNRFLDEAQLMKAPAPSSMQRDDFELKTTKSFAGEQQLNL